MDEQSGFNLLQAAVFEGEYDIVSKAAGLLDNFVKEMERTKTGNNAKNVPGKTAFDILSLIERRKFNHYLMKDFYEECAEDNSRLTELQWGTCNDDAEQAVELVLNDDVDINARASYYGCTALLWASRSSSSQFIETIIDLGADVNDQRRRRNYKPTPLMLAADWNNYMAVCLLLRHGASVNVLKHSGSTPLLLVVKKNHKSLVRLLLAYKVDVNIQAVGSKTALHKSVVKGDENLMRLFLELKADVNIQDICGKTPLHESVGKGDVNIVRLLLDHHVDVNIQDNRRETPLLRSFEIGNKNLVRLLVEHNAIVNVQDKKGCTPLHQYVKEGDENLVKLLLEHNADANIQDNNGYTALHQAVTPLHLSARFSHKNCNKIIDLLLQYGVQNIDIRDVEGRTPLQMAVRCGNAQAVKKLVDHGADVSVVQALETDARRLKRLKNEAKMMEQHLKVEMGYVQKGNETKHTTGVASVQGAEKLTESLPKLE